MRSFWPRFTWEKLKWINTGLGYPLLTQCKGMNRLSLPIWTNTRLRLVARPLTLGCTRSFHQKTENSAKSARAGYLHFGSKSADSGDKFEPFYEREIKNLYKIDPTVSRSIGKVTEIA